MAPLLHRAAITRCSPVAEGPRDALCQLKSCQLLHIWTKITFSKACKLEGRSRSSEIALFDRSYIISRQWPPSAQPQICFGGINFYCTILQSYILTSLAEISAQNNFQGLILYFRYIYRLPIYPSPSLQPWWPLVSTSKLMSFSVFKILSHLYSARDCL